MSSSIPDTLRRIADLAEAGQSVIVRSINIRSNFGGSDQQDVEINLIVFPGKKDYDPSLFDQRQIEAAPIHPNARSSMKPFVEDAIEVIPAGWHHGDAINNMVIENKAENFHISYVKQPSIGYTGSDETTIVAPNGYFILDGDFRKEYTPLIKKGLESCMQFWREHEDLHSSWSDDE